MAKYKPKKNGRPTLYKKELLEKAEFLGQFGMTEEHIASMLDVNPSTLTRWKQRHPEFCKAIFRGKNKAVLSVTEAMFLKAKGHVKVIPDTKVVDKQLVDVEKHIYIPPDTTGGMFWLKNMMNKIWKDRTESEDTKNVNVKVSFEEIRKQHEDVMGEQKKEKPKEKPKENTNRLTTKESFKDLLYN